MIKTVSELVAYLNGLKISQKSIDWMEDLSESDYKNYFENAAQVLSEENSDKRRWYEKADSAYSVLDGVIGVNYVCTLYSEMSEVEDLYHTLEFFEMKEVKITSYVKI